MILVTGGSKGIGRAIVRKALSEGKNVLAVARGLDGLEQLAQDSKALSGCLFTFSADLASKEGCLQLSDFVAKNNFQDIILVNNAGAYSDRDLIGEEDVFEKLLQLNLLAAHRLTRLLFARLKQVVTIGSVGALDLPIGMTAYAVSKYALHGWHHALVKEYADLPVRFLLVVPGATLTTSWEEETYIPPNILQPEQVADTVINALESPEKAEIVEIRPSA